MITDTDEYFDKLPCTLDKTKLEELGAPFHEVLLNYMLNSTPLPQTSTMASAALVLSMWQLRSHDISQHSPSTILLNAAEDEQDPIDKSIRSLIHNDQASQPGSNGNHLGLPIHPDKAPEIMARAIHERRKLADQELPHFLDRRNELLQEHEFRQARKSAYGSGVSKEYSKSWSDYFGLITDDEDKVILRLHDPEDRAAFRHDVLQQPDRLLQPRGIGRGLQEVSKTATVSGSLTVDLWDEDLVMGIINAGLPVVFLPHTGTDPLNIDNSAAMKLMLELWQHATIGPAGVSLRLPPIDWFEAHSHELKKRLRLIPGDGAYEFGILQLVHQLGSVCGSIVSHAGSNNSATAEKLATLFWGLHARTLRGITLGIAALAWHGLGFDPGCPHTNAAKALRDLRKKGSMTKSALLRAAHLNKKQRDVLLERLIVEDLVRVNRDVVTTTSFEEFVDALHKRPGLPSTAGLRETEG